jgi:hypothetical protein
MNFGILTNKNWMGMLGLAVGVVGVFCSIYFYNISKISREPVFLISPNRTIILDKERVTEAPLRVTRKDGTPINDYVSSVLLYFWNNGNMAIRKNEILEPLIFYFEDKNAEILDVKIITKSREVIKPALSMVDNRIKISFEILENNDGFFAQVIYAGDPKSNVMLDGTIIGVDKISTNTEMVERKFFSENMGVVIALIIVIASIFVFFLVLNFFEKSKIVKKLSTYKYFERATDLFFTCVVLVFIGGFLYFMVIATIDRSKKKAVSSVAELVPKDLGLVEHLNVVTLQKTEDNTGK